MSGRAWLGFHCYVVSKALSRGKQGFLGDGNGGWWQHFTPATPRQPFGMNTAWASLATPSPRINRLPVMPAWPLPRRIWGGNSQGPSISARCLELLSHWLPRPAHLHGRDVPSHLFSPHQHWALSQEVFSDSSDQSGLPCSSNLGSSLAAAVKVVTLLLLE